MKTSEILGSLPRWSNATADELMASPAWTMPCRLGDVACTMRLDALKPADTLDVSIMLENERHVLSLSDTPHFADLHRLWPTRADIPEPVILALVEKECGPLLQLIENAAHCQLKVQGLASAADDDAARLCARLCAEGSDVLSFAVTSSPLIARSFGKLLFIDSSHPSVREEQLPAVNEYAAFVLSAADLASLAPGDLLLLPEIGTSPARLVADGRFAIDGNGVVPFVDDGRLRVIDAAPHSITVGDILDRAQNPSAAEGAAAPLQLVLVRSGKTIAAGRLDRLGEQPAFAVETLPAT